MTSDDNYTHHYSKWHTAHPQHLETMQAFYRSALGNHFPKDKGAKILDVGCGMGFLLFTLNNLGYTKLKGIDLDAGQVQTARELKLNVEHTPDSVKFLRENQGDFEFIYAIDVIEHVSPNHQVEFLQALRRSLVPGGRLVCTVPNANSALAGRWRYIDWTHQTAFTEHSLEFLLSAAGFSEIEISDVQLFKKYESKPSTVKLFVESLVHHAMRSFRRLEMVSELGFDEGLKIPLSVNILGQAVRPSMSKK